MHRAALLVGLTAIISLTASACGKKSNSGGQGAPAAQEEPELADPGTDPEQTDGPQTVPAIDWAAFSLTFVKPSVEAPVSGNKIDIEIETDHPEDVTWSLYYSTNFKTVEGAVEIVASKPIAEKKHTWETSEVPSGRYFLFIELRYHQNRTVKFFSGSIAIERDGDANRSPFVVVDEDDLVRRNHAPGDTIDLAFRVADPNGDPLTLGLAYSGDDGETWTNILQDVAADDERFGQDGDNLTFAWTTPNNLAQGARYRVRLTADDGNGKSGESVSDIMGFTADPVYFETISGMLTTQCAGCHGETDPADDFRIIYFDNSLGADGANDKRNAIVDRTRPGADPAIAMPQNDPDALSQNERDLIQLWRWNNPRSGSEEPTLSLTAPAAAEQIDRGAGNYNVTFTATDPDAGDTVTVDVQISADDGGNYTDLASDISSPYAFDPGAHAAGTTYKFRFVVKDDRGRYVTVESETFELCDAPCM